jgi:hypothetical protein
MTDKKQQSPNWDKLEKDYVKYTHADRKIPGFPFDEKFPKFYGGQKYQLILSIGEMCKARVDDSKEFYSEGLEWQLLEDTDTYNRGQIIDRYNVAAWREI